MYDTEKQERAPATLVTTSDMALMLKLEKRKYQAKVKKMESKKQD